MPVNSESAQSNADTTITTTHTNSCLRCDRRRGRNAATATSGTVASSAIPPPITVENRCKPTDLAIPTGSLMNFALAAFCQTIGCFGPEGNVENGHSGAPYFTQFATYQTAPSPRASEATGSCRTKFARTQSR